MARLRRQGVAMALLVELLLGWTESLLLGNMGNMGGIGKIENLRRRANYRVAAAATTTTTTTTTTAVYRGGSVVDRIGAACPLLSRLSETRRYHNYNNSPPRPSPGNVATTTAFCTGVMQTRPPSSSRTALWASELNRVGPSMLVAEASPSLAPAVVDKMPSPPTLLPSAVRQALPGNISRRVTPEPLRQQPVETISWGPQPSTPAARLLSSDPIERFSGKDSHRGDDPPGLIAAVPALLGRLASELRPRALMGGGKREGSSRSLPPGREEQGLRELCSAISRVEATLSPGSSEAGQLREALHLLRSEKEAYAQERTTEVARIEAITKEYDKFRRQAALTEAELSRSNRRTRRAEAKHEEARITLSEKVGGLAHGLDKEKETFTKEMRAAGARHGGGEKGDTAGDEVARAYHERVRSLSDGLSSTQEQLAMLKSDRTKERREAGRARDHLAAQVALLEAQLQQAGQGVEQERADMEAVLLRLSNALAGVDVELTQSAGMTPSRETGRALRRAQEDFRRDQRHVKLLLEKQKQRYGNASRVMKEEAQRLRARTTELNDLRVGLAASEGKEKRLKSSVAALGGKVSTLDKELREARDALSQEHSLRQQAEAALLNTEELRERETVSLSRELEETRKSMTSTRKVYESTVGQREALRKAVTEKERAKKEADDRAEASEAALRKAIARREREVTELKAQVVSADRTLAKSEAEKQAQTMTLRETIDELTQEASRLEAQAEDGKKVVARTVTGVSRKAFVNASNVFQTVAPQGLLAKLGGTISGKLRELSTASAPPTPPPTTKNATNDSASTVPRSAPDSTNTRPLGRLKTGVDKARARTSVATSDTAKGVDWAGKNILRGFFGAEKGQPEGEAGKGGSPGADDGVRPPEAKRARRRTTGVVNGYPEAKAGAVETTAPRDQPRLRRESRRKEGDTFDHGEKKSVGRSSAVTSKTAKGSTAEIPTAHADDKPGGWKRNGFPMAGASIADAGTAKITPVSEPNALTTPVKARRQERVNRPATNAKRFGAINNGEGDRKSNAKSVATSTLRGKPIEAAAPPTTSTPRKEEANSSSVRKEGPTAPLSTAAEVLHKVTRAVFSGGGGGGDGTAATEEVVAANGATQAGAGAKTAAEQGRVSGSGKLGARRSRPPNGKETCSWSDVDVVHACIGSGKSVDRVDSVGDSAKSGKKRAPWARLVGPWGQRSENNLPVKGNGSAHPDSGTASATPSGKFTAKVGNNPIRTASGARGREGKAMETRAVSHVTTVGLESHFIGLGG